MDHGSGAELKDEPGYNDRLAIRGSSYPHRWGSRIVAWQCAWFPHAGIFSRRVAIEELTDEATGKGILGRLDVAVDRGGGLPREGSDMLDTPIFIPVILGQLDKAV